MGGTGTLTGSAGFLQEPDFIGVHLLQAVRSQPRQGIGRFAVGALRKGSAFAEKRRSF